MKKKTPSLVCAASALAIATCSLFADVVTEEMASAAATSFLESGGVAKLILGDSVVSSVETHGNLWIAHLDPQGHIIIAGSTKCSPVISFSTDAFTEPEDGTPFAEKLADNSAWVVSMEADETIGENAKWAGQGSVAKGRRKLLGAAETTTTTNITSKVMPLLGSAWYQNPPYNDLTPQAIVCGCMATAAGMEHRYWRWPWRYEKTRQVTHKFNFDKRPHIIRLNGSVPFDYEKMKSSYNGQSTSRAEDKESTYECAHLIVWMQSLVKMVFTPNGSYGEQKLCAEAGDYWFEDSNDLAHVMSQWRDGYDKLWTAITNDLAFGSPVQINTSGHQMVIDGFASELEITTTRDTEAEDDTGATAKTNRLEYVNVNYGWGNPTCWEELKTSIEIGSKAGKFADFQTGYRPKKIVQFEPVPKVSGTSLELAWHLPPCYTNRIEGFLVETAGGNSLSLEPVESLGDATERYTYTATGLETGYEYTFTVTPIMKTGEGDGLPNSVTTTIGEPKLPPTINSISVVGAGIELLQSGFFAECSMGATNKITVTCSESTTRLDAFPSHLTVLPDEKVSVTNDVKGVFTISLDATEMDTAWDGDMLLLTLIAYNDDGTETAKNLMLRFTSTRQVMDGTFDVAMDDTATDAAWFCGENTIIDAKGKSLTFGGNAFMGSGNVTLTDSVGGGSFTFEKLEYFRGTITFSNDVAVTLPADMTGLSGTINILGTHTLSGTMPDTATLNVAKNAVVTLSGANIAAAITGAGTINVAAGVNTISGNIASGVTVELTGGSLVVSTGSESKITMNGGELDIRLSAYETAYGYIASIPNYHGGTVRFVDSNGNAIEDASWTDASSGFTYKGNVNTWTPSDRNSENLYSSTARWSMGRLPVNGEYARIDVGPSPATISMDTTEDVTLEELRVVGNHLIVFNDQTTEASHAIRTRKFRTDTLTQFSSRILQPEVIEPHATLMLADNIMLDATVESDYASNVQQSHLQDSSKWRGTVLVAITNMTNFCSANNGNTLSKVRMTGAQGYFQNGVLNSVPIELVDGPDGEIALYHDNGSFGQNVVIGKLIGDGTYKTASWYGRQERVLFRDTSEFAGSMQFSVKTIVFGDTVPSIVPESDQTPEDGRIYIASESTIFVPTGKTWKVGGTYIGASQIFDINGTLDTPRISTFGEGSVLNLNDGATIKVSEAVSGDYALTQNFYNGTYMIGADIRETNTVTFCAVGDDKWTTIDACGHTVTLGAKYFSGNGRVYLYSSETGGAYIIEGIDESFTGNLMLDSTATVTLPTDLSGTNCKNSIYGMNIWRNSNEIGDTQIEVGSGATLTITVTTMEAVTGFTAKGVTFVGGTLEFVDENGNVVFTSTSENSFSESRNIWIADGDGNGNLLDAARWTKNVVPTSGEDVVIFCTGDTTLTIDATETLALGSVTVKGTGTLTIVDGDGATAPVTATEFTNNLGTTINATLFQPNTLKPTATIEIGDGANLASDIDQEYTSLMRQSDLTDAEKWRGTVVVTNLRDFNSSQYGNGNSKVRMTGATGYFAPAVTNEVQIELVDGEDDTPAVYHDNGYSGNNVFIGKLIGDGTYKTGEPLRGTSERIVFMDTTEFAGTFDFATKTIYLGDVIPSESYGDGRIYVCSANEINIPTNKTWKTAGGIYLSASQVFNVNGTLVTPIISTYGNGPILNLRDDSMISVGAAVSGGYALTQNFQGGTYQITADVMETSTVNFCADEGKWTTLDANGHTMTLGAGYFSGAGDVYLTTSVEGGAFVIEGLGDAFTGRLMLDSSVNVTLPTDISASKCTIAISGTNMTRTTSDIGDAKVEVGESATLTIKLTEREILTGFTAGGVSFTGGSVTFVDGDDNEITTSESDNSYASPLNVWRTDVASGRLDDVAHWSKGVLPTNGEDVVIVITGDTTLTVDATNALSLGLVLVDGAGTLTIVDENGDGEEATVTTARKFDNAVETVFDGVCFRPEELAPSATVALGENGMLYGYVRHEYFSFVSSVLTNANWRGTFIAKDLTASETRDMHLWGNANSFIRLTNVSGPARGGATVTAEVILDNEDSEFAWHISAQPSSMVIIKKLSGTGTIKASCNYSHKTVTQFQDASEFSGSIIQGAGGGRLYVSNVSGGMIDGDDQIVIDRGFSIRVGDGKSWASGYNGIKIRGTVEIEGNAEFSGSTELYNGATLKFDSLSTESAALVFNNALSFNDSGNTVNIAFGDGVALEYGQKLVSWKMGNPSGTFAFAEPNEDFSLGVVGNELVVRGIEDGTTLSIGDGKTWNFAAGETKEYSEIVRLSSSGTIAVTNAANLSVGTYTLATWTTPQVRSSGYGHVGTLDATGMPEGMTAELVYGASAIYLHVYNEEAQAEKPTLKIWPYGDSITEGYNLGGTRANYRVLLAQKLSLLGYNVEMVGCYDTVNGVNAIDPSGKDVPDNWKWHSAKHGATAGPTTNYKRSNLCENVDSLCTQVDTPDAVLLHIGVNDLAESAYDENTTFVSLTNIIARLVANLPNTKVVASTALRQLETARDNTEIDRYNTLMRDFFQNMPAEWNGHVYFADLANFVQSQDYGILYAGSGDNLHPDWWGHDQMAEGWLSVITNIYQSATGTFPSSATRPEVTDDELGAAAKTELADYTDGFTRYGVLEVTNGLDIADITYSDVNGEADTENIGKVGYFVEYVRADNNAHKWVWVDMDVFGDFDIASAGLPTANHQQTVTRLHVKSNHNGIDDVAADDDTVTGWIEFSPYDYAGNSSGITDAPLAHGGNSATLFDWNDRLGITGTMGCMQVFRRDPPSLRAAQLLFAYNNWRDEEGAAEFGIGNFSQHFHGGDQTLDYTSTKGLEKMNADAYSVKRIEIWTKPVENFKEADGYTITNDGYGLGGNSASTFTAGSDTFTITIPVTNDFEIGTLVRVDSIALGTDTGWSNTLNIRYIVITGEDGEMKSQIVNGTGQDSGAKFANDNAGSCSKQTFRFINDCLLKVGKTYSISMTDENGSIVQQRYRMVKNTNAALNPIKQSFTSVNEWRIHQEVTYHKVHTATMTGDANFDELSFSPELPTDSSASFFRIYATDNATLTFDGERSVDAITFQIDSNKTVTLNNATITAQTGIRICGGAVKVSSASALSGTVGGDGTIIYNGVRPTTTGTDIILTSDDWRGVVCISGYNISNTLTQGARALYPQYWGSKNSKIKWNGVCGYFNGQTSKAGWILEDLTINGTTYPALKKNDGGSSWTTLAPTLEGSGTFIDVSNPTETFRFANAHNFSGNITIDRSGSNGMNVQFGENTAEKSIGCITILSNATQPITEGAVWTAANGLVMMNNSTLVAIGNAQINAPIYSDDGDNAVIYVEEGKTLTVTGRIYGSHKIIKRGLGTLVLTCTNGDDMNYPICEKGTIELGGSNAHNLGSMRDLGGLDGYTIGDGSSVTVAQTRAEDASGTTRIVNVPTGITPLWLATVDGSSQELEVIDGTATYGDGTVRVDDSVCTFDWGFNSNLNSTGYNTNALTYDGYNANNSFAFGENNTNLYIRTHPFYNSNDYGLWTWNSDWTVAIKCTVPATTNTIIIAFGSMEGGCIGLATSPDEGKVMLFKAGSNTNYISIADLEIQDASTIQHLYIFTKTSAGNIKIYCDGTPIYDEHLEGLDSLPGTLQVGSLHGGINYIGLVRPTSTDPAIIDFVKVYNYAINDAMQEKLIASYAYGVYTVTWQNYDGTMIDTTSCLNGAMPAYTGETPTKEATVQYTYTFAGWTPELAVVSGDTTYTAKYDEVLRYYTVTWLDEDGSELASDSVAYGATPTFTGKTPTKSETTQYTYEFSGWAPTIAEVSGDVTYTPVFVSHAKWTGDGTHDTPYELATPNRITEILALDDIGIEGILVRADTGMMTAIDEVLPDGYAVTPSDIDDVVRIIHIATIVWQDEDGTPLATNYFAYGETPAYGDEDPNKAATAQYTYTFDGWAPEIEAATSNATYTATYTETVNEYTITWQNYDGNVLQSDLVAYGDTPAYTNELPTKTATAQYTYAFDGWNNEITAVTGDATYTATFSSTLNTYTITWENDDGTELASESVAYGETPAYKGETPTKAATAQYTYTFSGWTPTIEEVAGDATYTATYIETLNTYTITWLNDDNSLIGTTTVAYGETPVHGNPSKTPDAQYSYTFAGWTPNIVAVTGNATYTATYNSAVNTYTITWNNDDDSLIGTTTVAYGETPEYNNPSKSPDAQYTYTFKGWTPNIVAVTGNATYTATYNSTVNTYTITWMSESSVIDTVTLGYGETPSHTNLYKNADAQYTYTFAGWVPDITTVTGDATYTAKYNSTVNEYTIIWQDEDGTGIDTNSVAYGKMPAYTNVTPTKAATAQFTYTFAGWEPTVANVTSNTIYTATYTNTVNHYEIIWQDEDGTGLATNSVAYGEMPEYIGTPTKAATAQFTYTFAGWEPTVTNVTSNAIYTATYTETVNEYEITWCDFDGTLLGTENLAYGNTPNHDEPENNIHQFTGWIPEVEQVTSNATYTATFNFNEVVLDKLTEDYQANDGEILSGSTKIKVTIPGGVTVTFNGIEVTGGGSDATATTPEPEFANDGKAATTEFVMTDDGNVAITTFVELSNDAIGADVTADMIKVYASETIEGLESAEPMDDVNIAERKSAVKTTVKVAPPAGAKSQFFKVKFGK